MLRSFARQPIRCGLGTRCCSSQIQNYIKDTISPAFSIPTSVLNRVGVSLHQRPGHPLNTIKVLIEEHFARHPAKFKSFDSFSPIVSTKQNFDDLLTPPDHVSRSPADTFYINETSVLRTHTSAHQTQLLSTGENAFLVTGDVYRRDTVDASHYPIFHQMEGVRIFSESEIPHSASSSFAEEVVMKGLQNDLEGVVKSLFGDVQMRWVEAYFPFTHPSLELEIFFNGEWLEVLGCGKVHQKIMDKCQRGHQHGHAFGLGLERLAMVLFDIPDIRLFWTEDERFHKQFQPGEITKFQPYSKFPACYKDVSFWLPPTYHENDFHALARDVAGDLLEEVKLLDDFTHPKTEKRSHCYRLLYRSMDRSLTNEEVDELQASLRKQLQQQLHAELR